MSRNKQHADSKKQFLQNLWIFFWASRK